MSVLINLSALLDDAKCFELVRQTRWPQGVRCRPRQVLQTLSSLLSIRFPRITSEGSTRHRRAAVPSLEWLELGWRSLRVA